MNEFEIWIAGIFAAAIVGVLGWVASVLTRLPVDYIPRDQLNERFNAIRREMHEDIQATEARTEKRFDSVESKLDKILDKLEQKADKQP